LLLLAVLLVLTAAGSLLFRRRSWDMALAAVGLVALGRTLFGPLVAGFGLAPTWTHFGFVAPLLVSGGAVAALGGDFEADARANGSTYIARGIGVFGLSLFVVGIWVKPVAYWDIRHYVALRFLRYEHALGITMVILAVLAALMLIGMSLHSHWLFEIIFAGLGFVAVGLAIAVPLLGSDALSTRMSLAARMSLAVFGPSLVAAGASALLFDARVRRVRLISGSAMALGVGLFVASIWPALPPRYDAANVFRSYASKLVSRHVYSSTGVGISLLILVLLSVIAIGGALVTGKRVLAASAGCLGLISLGYVLFWIVGGFLDRAVGFTLAGAILMASGGTVLLLKPSFAPRDVMPRNWVARGGLTASAVGILLLTLSILTPRDATGYSPFGGGFVFLGLLLYGVAFAGVMLLRGPLSRRAELCIATILLGYTLAPIHQGPQPGAASKGLSLAGSILLVAGALLSRTPGVTQRESVPVETLPGPPALLPPQPS
jgi:hypothetical protein